MIRKRLGQHFLFDPSILKRIVDAARLSPEDTVVEIGPGLGRLTALLAEHVARVIAIELDEKLFERLEEEFPGHPVIELVHGDALRYPYEQLDRFKVVANIPYYITTPILFRLLEQRGRIRSITIMTQKEVAERVVAKPGGKDYGVLSIMAQYRGHPELKFIVPRGAFRPVPKVDSAVIHLEVPEGPTVPVGDERLFTRIVKVAFSQRRKTLANALKSVSPEMRELLIGAGIDPARRAETLSIEEFAGLADAVARRRSGP